MAPHAAARAAKTPAEHHGRVIRPHFKTCGLSARDDTSGNSCKAKLATKHRRGAGQGPTPERADCGISFSVRDKYDAAERFF